MGASRRGGTGRIFIFGIDGATFDIILPLVEQGKMPAIEKLMKEGSWARLSSTHPPMTPSAWTSFMTGRKPENHGIFDFTNNEMTGPRYSREFVNSTIIKCHTIYDVLRFHGKKSLIIGMPMTYPPFEVNGALISGFMTPGDYCDYTYPKSLKAELLVRFGDYFLDPNPHTFDEFDEQDFIKSCFPSDQSKVKAARYLAGVHKDWDMLTVIFSTVDHIQHYFWKYLDPFHPAYDSEKSEIYRRTIEHFYVRHDQYLQSFLDGLAPNDTVLVVSDHGCGPTRVVFNLDNWLEQNGYLKRNRRIALKNKVKSICRGVVDSMRTSLGFTPRKWKELHGRVLYGKTRAFSGYTSEMGLYLNEKGKRPMGIVSPDREYGALRNELISALKEIREPKSGERIFDWVRPREDVYDGDLSKLAPDILFGNRPGYAVYPSLSENLFDYYPVISGDHEPEGIFIASGPAIRENCEIESAHIVDMAPTILYLMGLPIDGNMDGRLIDEMIRGDYLQNHPPEFFCYTDLQKRGDEKCSYSEDESQLIEEKLKALGYL